MFVKSHLSKLLSTGVLLVGKKVESGAKLGSLVGLRVGLKVEADGLWVKLGAFEIVGPAVGSKVMVG